MPKLLASLEITKDREEFSLAVYMGPFQGKVKADPQVIENLKTAVADALDLILTP